MKLHGSQTKGEQVRKYLLFLFVEGMCAEGEGTMLKIEKTEVTGWEHAIRGMRNPMNSWDKSDSCVCQYAICNGMETCPHVDNGTDMLRCDNAEYYWCMGCKDFDLMKRLVKAGSDHAKFMRMITVYVDITAPLYWWKEFDTYKVGTVANSCSTMHKIHAKEFTLDDFSHEHLTDEFLYSDKRDAVTDEYVCIGWTLLLLEQTVNVLNVCRKRFIETKDKKYWWQMIQLLPSSYNQKRTVQLNYAVLRNMYHARKNHKLDEWREFCYWIEQLPYSELITE